MTAVLQIRLFGGLEVRQGEAPIGSFVSSKAPALLAYLAVTRHPHQRDALAALLWGEMADADAKNNLRQTLSNLRKLLEPHLIISRESVQFETAVPHTLDTAQFEDLLQASHTPGSTRFDHLAEAAALYHGDFLAGFFVRDAPEFEEWLLAQRVRYRELALHALHTLTDYHLSRGEYGRAIDSATRLLALDAWREETHRQLMLALARSGQRTAALQQYETCRRLLKEELDVPPSAETTTLFERIGAAVGPQHNLPLHPAPFVGREKEMTRIETWVADSYSRLLTIVGAGGMGKTRLALQAAHAHVGHFLEGAWYVSLFPVANGAGIITAVASAIGLQFSDAKNLDRQLLDYLSPREMLLVIDNVEHLLTNENLSLLAALVAQAPMLKLLVTSRERLNLHAETLLELGGLPYPEAQPLLETGLLPTKPITEHLSLISQFPAVKLFTERAQQLRGDFQLAGQEMAVSRLCQLVQGLPLALELAAAWIRVLAVPEIVAEIEQGLDFLAAPLHDMPERHRSLRAVFDYSWQLLTPQEQDAYRRLAVFRGGFTREAALEMIGRNLFLLAGLVDKSLLRRDSDNRYRRHPLLLEFATNKLAADPILAAEVRKTHAHYYGRFLHTQEAVLMGGRSDTALALIRPEMENLRLAWHYAVEMKDTAVINHLADSFMQIFDLFGLYREGRDLAVQAVASLSGHIDATQAEPAIALGRAYGLSGAFHFRLGEYDLALKHSQTSWQTIAPFQPHVAYGHALIYAGAAAFGLGDFPQVVAHWQAASAAYQQAQSVWGEAVAQGNLAEVMLALGETASAHQYAATALALARRMENPDLIANTLGILAAIAQQEKRYREATAYGQEALGLHRQIDHSAHTANDLATLANIASEQGEVDKALGYLRESVWMLRRVGNRLYLVQRLVELGQVALAARQFEEAENVLQEALADAIASNTLNVALQALLALAELRYQQGQPMIALQLAAFVSQQEAATNDTRVSATAAIQAFSAHFSAEQITAVHLHTQTLNMTAVMKGLLAGERTMEWGTAVINPLPSRFTLHDLIARGGMGEVYRATDTQTGQPVAVKRLLPHLTEPNSEAMSRFQREAEVLRQLNHPNIVQIITTIETAGQMMIVMEYVPGGSLRELLSAGNPLPLSQVLTIALELADGLARSHHLHIIHRDLKPENVLLAADGTPRLSDFGIAGLSQSGARLTQQGDTLGTFAYMSPEACRGEQLTAQTDIWSFGVMLYEMLAGRNPFEKGHVAATVTAVLHDTPPLIIEIFPEIPLALSRLLAQMLSKEPQARLSTMRQAAAQLEQIRSQTG